ncbi:MAG: TonB-dependent receptor, partial [Bacteroidetes bacterium]|nr:TonB-dependent receptor [Bacteroidota bacterium]
QSIGLRLNYTFSENSEAKAGVQIKELNIHPGELTPINASSSIDPLIIQNEKAREMGFYFQHDFDIFTNFRMSYGLRYNIFQYLGANTVNMYDEDLVRITDNIIDQITFGKNEVINQYDGFEPRLAFRWSINDGTSIKLGFNRMYQYIHLITNTASIAPTDIWKLSDTYVKPQIATQYSVGFFKNFNDNSTETSVEVYYKNLDNVLEYKDGAQLILNENLETELLSGDGKAFGIELYAKKTIGRLSGWASYTYSRSLRTVQGAYPEERINQGEEYPSNFDKPHDLTAVMEFNISRNTKFSSIFTYSTGRAVTFPGAKFKYSGREIAYFDTRNESRAPDYHRVDVSLTFKFRSTKKLLQGNWVLSIYNLYGRKNAFYVFFDDVSGKPPQAYKLSVVGIPFPALSYSFKF